MENVRTFIFFCLTISSLCAQLLEFPDEFKFGVATASYQIEGGWNANGKGENMWDRLVHSDPKLVKDQTNGDIACDSYHKIDEDVANLAWLKVDHYRFSLSWSRILPNGFANQINPDGIRYYNELIDKLLAKNITPMVTLYHWDLPQPLQDIGGWTNPYLADIFADYAQIAFKYFGDRVKMWITFNEPAEVCQESYGNGGMAPGYTYDGIAPYMCGHTLIKAHAKAFRLYDKLFRGQQQGKVGITVSSRWQEPKTDSPDDIKASNRGMQMNLGWWAHPIFSKEGDYPKVMKDRIAFNSRRENLTRSRLPQFTKEEIKFIQGTFDFMGLNHYTSRLVSLYEINNYPIPSFNRDIGIKYEIDPDWPKSASPWLQVVPWGFKKLLNWIKKEYDNPEVIVTENGFSDKGQLHDAERIRYINDYMHELLEAIRLDNCNVTGYTLWSLMDNFEWREGFTQRFGLFYVNISDPNRARTPKDSAYVYQSIIRRKKIISLSNYDYSVE